MGRFYYRLGAKLSNLESQKKNAEALARSVMLGDQRLGNDLATSEDKRFYVLNFTRLENLHDLFHVILRITKN